VLLVPARTGCSGAANQPYRMLVMPLPAVVMLCSRGCRAIGVGMPFLIFVALLIVASLRGGMGL